MKMHIINIMISALLVLLSTCSAKREFSSQEELITAVIEYINKGRKDKLFNTFIPAEEYIESIHPFTDVGKEKNALPAEEFWDTFIGMRRDYAALTKIRNYKDRIIHIKSIGEPDKIIDTGEFEMLRRIPLTLTISNDDGTISDIIDDEILGVVIKRNNKFRLLNVFR
ncbi:MAG: hypothetical protein SVZ03_12050 [Spirochaetota bacterium]|nr:hypothetical protein [Spirochaetota bacterium]